MALGVKGEDRMKVIAGDSHDPCVASYQCLEADQLNTAQKACGIDAPGKRREIVEHFLFHGGYFRDARWFEQDGRRFRPIMCFGEVTENGESTDALLIPDPNLGTLFHEYAHGAAAWLFEDQSEDASSIEVGDVSR
jgi:hypothetical protein